MIYYNTVIDKVESKPGREYNPLHDEVKGCVAFFDGHLDLNDRAWIYFVDEFGLDSRMYTSPVIKTWEDDTGIVIETINTYYHLKKLVNV